MSETLTGRTRLRPGTEYGTGVLIFQVEVECGVQDENGRFLTSWRDAKIEDLAIALRGLPFAQVG